VRCININFHQSLNKDLIQFIKSFKYLGFQINKKKYGAVDGKTPNQNHSSQLNPLYVHDAFNPLYQVKYPTNIIQARDSVINIFDLFIKF